MHEARQHAPDERRGSERQIQTDGGSGDQGVHREEMILMRTSVERHGPNAIQKLLVIEEQGARSGILFPTDSSLIHVQQWCLVSERAGDRNPHSLVDRLVCLCFVHTHTVDRSEG